MTVEELYAAVAEHLVLLKSTGEDWDLYWFEAEFEMGIKRGSKTVFRAPWIGKIYEWTRLEVERQKLFKSDEPRPNQ